MTKRTTTQMPGAWPTGSRVVKLEKVSANETIPVGSVGTVLGSTYAGEALVYCIVYDNVGDPIHHVYLPGRFALIPEGRAA